MPAARLSLGMLCAALLHTALPRPTGTGHAMCSRLSLLAACLGGCPTCLHPPAPAAHVPLPLCQRAGACGWAGWASRGALRWCSASWPPCPMACGRCSRRARCCCIAVRGSGCTDSAAPTAHKPSSVVHMAALPPWLWQAIAEAFKLLEHYAARLHLESLGLMPCGPPAAVYRRGRPSTWRQRQWPHRGSTQQVGRAMPNCASAPALDSALPLCPSCPGGCHAATCRGSAAQPPHRGASLACMCQASAAACRGMCSGRLHASPLCRPICTPHPANPAQPPRFRPLPSPPPPLLCCSLRPVGPRLHPV